MPYQYSRQNYGRRPSQYGRRRRPSYGNRKPKASAPNRASSYSQVAYDALRLAKWTAAMLNPEHKRIDNVYALSVGTTPAIQTNNACAQGDTVSTRNGNSWKMTSTMFDGYIRYNPSATAGVQTLRWIVILDANPEGAVPVMTDLYTAATVDGIISPDVAPGRFTILKDKKYNLSPQTPQIMVRESYLQKPVHCKYNSNVGTVADQTRNSLITIAVSDDNTNKPFIGGYVRCKFLDN